MICYFDLDGVFLVEVGHDQVSPRRLRSHAVSEIELEFRSDHLVDEAAG